MHTIAAVVRLSRWPFVSRLASPVWLALRIYLGSVWLQFGLAKIQGGWLASNPLESLLGAIAAGQVPTPLPFYSRIAAVLVNTGADQVLSFAIPLVEVAISVAFFASVFLVPAAVGAILLNINLILSGIASLQFDGRIIALQLLLLLAWRVAGTIGLGTLISRLRHHWPAAGRPPETRAI